MKTPTTKKVTNTKSVKKTPAKKTTKKTGSKVVPDTNNIPEIKDKSPVKTCANCSGCSDCQDAMTESFIQEVTEDVKNDNLKAFWNKYGLYIILFVIISVSAAVGFETIKTWRQKQFQEKTQAYISAMIEQGNYDKSISALEKIVIGNYGIYSQLARIQIADILFEQNKTEEAINMLQAIIDNSEINSKVRNLAILKLATYKVDTASIEEISELLKPVIEENNVWSPLAQDMIAMSAIKAGDFQKARTIYTQLLQNANLSDNFKNRIQDMLSALSDM